MTHLITALMDDIHVPYGVNVLWNPTASIDLAVGASFVREIFSGVCASDFGLWNTNFGEVIRYQHPAGGQKIRLLFKIVPEAAAHLAGRDIPSIAKSTVFNHRPDDLCVSGLTAGVPTDSLVLKSVKQAVPDTRALSILGFVSKMWSLSSRPRMGSRYHNQAKCGF